MHCTVCLAQLVVQAGMSWRHTLLPKARTPYDISFCLNIEITSHCFVVFCEKPSYVTDRMAYGYEYLLPRLLL